MYCEKCGSQIDDDSVFCQKCGEKQIDFNNKSDINIKTSRPKKINKVAVVVLILFFLACAIIVIAAITNGRIADSNKNKTNPSYQYQPKYDNPYDNHSNCTRIGFDGYGDRYWSELHGYHYHY